MPIPAGGGDLPEWAPTRGQVADYIPHRTLVRSDVSTVGSADTYRFTWDETTTPTGDAVDRLIADGAAWVTGRVGTLNTTLTGMAAVVVALYAAAAVERGWPNDDQSLQRANDLEKRMDAMLGTLVGASNAVNGTGDFGLTVSPVWSFPAADRRWDYPGYF